MIFTLPEKTKNGESIVQPTVDYVSLRHFSAKDSLGNEEPSLILADLSAIVSASSQQLFVFDQSRLQTDTGKYYYTLIHHSAQRDIQRLGLTLASAEETLFFHEKAKRVMDNLYSANDSLKKDAYIEKAEAVKVKFIELLGLHPTNNPRP